MRIFNATLGLILILLGAIASDTALAGRGHSGYSARSGHSGHSGNVARSGHHHSHGRFGVFFGAPIFAPFYFPPSGYYYTPPLPVSPPAYIEQNPALPTPVQPPYFWYYCAGSNTYYPYVDVCPGGWQQVVPETPPPS